MTIIKKILVLSISLFIYIGSAVSQDSYKNELMRVGFSNLGVSDVKVTLYTAKPYSEPLRFLKKNDSEFVLILPETYNSAPQKPSISDVIGEITDVNIRLYSFASNSTQNGYTKIVINTNGSVNLYPEAVAIGGGHIVNEEINKIVASKITPTQTQTTPKAVIVKPTQAAKPAETPTKTETTKKEIISLKLPIIPKLKQEKPVEKIAQNTKTQKEIKSESAKKQTAEPVKEEITEDIEPKTVPQKDTTVTINEPEDISVNDNVDNSQVKENDNTDNKKTSYSFYNKSGFNLLGLLVAFLLFAFGIKLQKSVVAKPENTKTTSDSKKDTDTTNKTSVKTTSKTGGEYSSFFKMLIDSEVKGENAFQLNNSVVNDNNINVDFNGIKTHKDALNIDQNLSWQEKFRAIQNNKRALLEEETNNNNYKNSYEIEDNMNIENPIKKLKQDFRAVRKVLEKQQQKGSTNNPIQQKINSKKSEQNVEIISFEDYQKEVTPPKVQVKTSMPLESKPPKILSQLPLNDERGLYLINYNGNVALIGYIKDKVFKLSSYPYLNNTRLYARLSESVNGKDTYIVKFDKNKMLIDVVNDNMQIKLIY